MSSGKDIFPCAHTNCVEFVCMFFCPSLCMCVVVSEDIYDIGTRVHTLIVVYVCSSFFFLLCVCVLLFLRICMMVVLGCAQGH